MYQFRLKSKKLCQEEHWRKVHMKHCRYLGGTKKADHSEHKQNTCETCIKAKALGDLIFSPTNPDYVCIYEHVDFQILPDTFPLPFPFTGSPEDRMERMLTAVQRILLKIKATKNQVYLVQPQHVEGLEKDLWDLRSKIYINRIRGGDQYSLEICESVASILFYPGLSSWRPIAGEARRYAHQMFQDIFKPLATLALLMQLISNTVNFNLEHSLSMDSLPLEHREMSKKDQFFEVVDRILEALDKEMVPFHVLAAIACGGRRGQRCSQCCKQIVLQGFSIDEFTFRMSDSDVFISPVEGLRYTCEAPECFGYERRRYSDKVTPWMATVMATHTKLQGTRCDGCFLMAPLNEVRRSRCLTKNYCSQVCRDTDNAAHKVCCNPESSQGRIEDRKVKIGGKEKVATANAMVDGLGKLVMKDLPELSKPTLAKQFEEAWEKTKKTKTTTKSAKK